MGTNAKRAKWKSFPDRELIVATALLEALETGDLHSSTFVDDLLEKNLVLANNYKREQVYSKVAELRKMDKGRLGEHIDKLKKRFSKGPSKAAQNAAKSKQLAKHKKEAGADWIKAIQGTKFSVGDSSSDEEDESDESEDSSSEEEEVVQKPTKKKLKMSELLTGNHFFQKSQPIMVANVDIGASSSSVAPPPSSPVPSSSSNVIHAPVAQSASSTSFSSKNPPHVQLAAQTVSQGSWKVSYTWVRGLGRLSLVIWDLPARFRIGLAIDKDNIRNLTVTVTTEPSMSDPELVVTLHPSPVPLMLGAKLEWTMPFPAPIDLSVAAQKELKIDRGWAVIRFDSNEVRPEGLNINRFVL